MSDPSVLIGNLLSTAVNCVVFVLFQKHATTISVYCDEPPQYWLVSLSIYLSIYLFLVIVINLEFEQKNEWIWL